MAPVKEKGRPQLESKQFRGRSGAELHSGGKLTAQGDGGWPRPRSAARSSGGGGREEEERLLPHERRRSTLGQGWAGQWQEIPPRSGCLHRPSVIVLLLHVHVLLVVVDGVCQQVRRGEVLQGGSLEVDDVQVVVIGLVAAWRVAWRAAWCVAVWHGATCGGRGGAE